MSNALELARKLVAELEKQGKSDKVELSTLNPGETFKIGEHDFIVLEQMQRQTAVISKGFMAKDVKFDKETTDYNNSNLKKVIETEIQPIIANNVGSDNIVEHDVDLISVDMQEQYDKCKCKVRPITFDEARKYNDFLTNKDLNDWWWTCTPWSTEKRGWKCRVAVVSPSGYIRNDRCDYDGGVRPFCILKSNIFVSKGDK